MDSDDLHDEAERLAQAHPQYGFPPDRHTSDWLPQHAVPRYKPRPPMSHIDLAYIERRVQADIDAIDRELDPQEPPRSKVFGNLLVMPENFQDAHSFTADAWVFDPHGNVQIIDFKTVDLVSRMHRAMEKTARLSGMYSTGAPKPPKQRKPKTYVAPGRRQGKTWIARLNQSKEATNARNRNR